MRIIILHGNDTSKLYTRLTKFTDEAKKRGWKITDYNIQEIENQNLFTEECFYVLKDYKLLDKKVIEKLEKYSGNLIVYNEGKIPALSLKQFKPTKIELFELPQLLWKFLDTFDVHIFRKIIETQPVEYILAMMAWKLKQKYIKNPTAEVSQMISDLAILDVKAKTGKTNLLLSLDLLLSKKIL